MTFAVFCSIHKRVRMWVTCLSYETCYRDIKLASKEIKSLHNLTIEKKKRLHKIKIYICPKEMKNACSLTINTQHLFRENTL